MNKFEIAEKRIEEAQERAKYFAEKYKQTGSALYKEMRDEEIETVNKIVEALCKAKLAK